MGAVAIVKLFKRRNNPIFIEEEKHNWQKSQSVGPKVLFLVVTFIIVITVLYAFLR